jgi:hypothetical protein
MTTAQDQLIDRVSGYIRHNATKEPPAIRGFVQQGHQQLATLLDAMSEEQAAFKPGPDDWSVLELLAHVVTAKRGVARICERLGRGEQVANFGGEGEEQDGVTRVAFASLAEARRGMDAAHDALLAFIDGPLAAAGLTPRYGHFLFGDLNCREWAVFQRVHDGDHAGQITQITSARGYPTS